MPGKHRPGRYRRLTPTQRESAKRAAMQWARENHPRRKIHMATHKLKRLASGGPSATGEQLRRLWEKQGGRCALTGVPISVEEAHLDHIRPTSKGGKHTIKNLRWTHPMANRAKGTQTDREFWQWIEQVIVNYKRV